MAGTREPFGDFDPSEHAGEAAARWGGTREYRESARRTARYTAEDWAGMRRQADEVDAAFLALMQGGIEPADPAAAAVVDRHRNHISQWFYHCSPEIHAGLGRMYADDDRFRDRIDRAGAGLARYIADAIAARYRT